MGDERDADEGEDEEAILRRREELIRRATEEAHRTPPGGIEARPLPCLAYAPPPTVTRRGGARPWVWIAAAVFVGSVAIALWAVRLLQLM